MSDATTTLLTSWEEHVEDLGDGFRSIRFSAGEPHERAIYNAALHRYNDFTGRPVPTPELAESLLGEKITLVTWGENMIGGGMIVAREGTIRTGAGNNLMILPKRARKKGFRLDFSRMLDILPGYSTEAAKTLIDSVVARFPKLKPLTQERLNAMPAESDTLGLCVFGTHRLPDSEQGDAIAMYSEYMRDDDILDRGVVIVRPEHGVSEHGSMYGQHLLRGAYGEVVGYEPISFDEGIRLCNLDFDEAYTRVIPEAA